MIDRLQGFIIQKSPTFCVVDCHGLGIGLFISINTYQKLGEEGNSVNILTYLHVRDDALQLYGFNDEDERNIFRQLINISGIGPRLALTILSGLTVDEFIQAVTIGNFQLLTKIPGVGKKTAQRVILELKENIGERDEAAQLAEFQALSNEERDRINEVLLALITLGYKQSEAKKAVERVIKQNSKDLPLEELIKLSLREF